MKKLWLILIVLIIAIAVIFSIIFLIPEKVVDCTGDEACYEASVPSCNPSESTLPETGTIFKIIGKKDNSCLIKLEYKVTNITSAVSVLCEVPIKNLTTPDDMMRTILGNFTAYCNIENE